MKIDNILFVFSGHGPGLVTLQVACEGYIISNSCVFEYKSREDGATETDKQWEWFSVRGE